MKFTESTTLGQLQMERASVGNPKIGIRTYADEEGLVVVTVDSANTPLTVYGKGRMLHDALNDGFSKYRAELVATPLTCAKCKQDINAPGDPCIQCDPGKRLRGINK